MRILTATNTYSPAANGQAVFVHSLAEGLATRGQTVLVATPSEYGTPKSSFASTGVQLKAIHSIPLTLWHPDARVTVTNRHAAKDLMRRFRPDVVHIHDHYPLCRAFAQEAHRLHIPLVATNHFLPDNLSPYLPGWLHFAPLYRWVLWRWMVDVYRLADVVTVQSASAAVILRGQGLGQPMQAISCGVNTRRFAPMADLDREAVRMRLGLPLGKTLALFVGRLDREKRLDVLLRGLACIQRTDIHLAIAGQGAAAQELRELAQRLGLEAKVHFLGHVSDNDLPLLLNCADIFAMPSDAELLSIATLEAMASGKPILAAQAQALPELVTDGENGLLFCPGDVQDAARALERFAGQPNHWAAMGAASRRRAEQHSHEEVLRSYECLYDSMQTQSNWNDAVNDTAESRWLPGKPILSRVTIQAMPVRLQKGSSVFYGEI